MKLFKRLVSTAEQKCISWSEQAEIERLMKAAQRNRYGHRDATMDTSDSNPERKISEALQIEERIHSGAAFAALAADCQDADKRGSKVASP